MCLQIVEKCHISTRQKIDLSFVEIQDYDLSYLQEILGNIYDVHDKYPESTVNSYCLKFDLLDLLTGRSRLQGDSNWRQNGNW